MTDPRANPPVPPFRDIPTAPFVYFDLAAAYGVLAGAIEIELAARTLIPSEDGATKAEIVTTARLRCSPAAAASLGDALTKALEMLRDLQQQSGPSAAGAASKLN